MSDSDGSQQSIAHPKTFSFFTTLQYTTTGVATLLFLRSLNRFITHRQRGQAILGAVAMTPDIPPKLLEYDCNECRITGTLSCTSIGIFILYQSSGGFYKGKPYIQAAVRSLAAASFYLGAARWFYFPPFSYLKQTNQSNDKN